MNQTEKRRTVNIALIGCGFMGKEHSKAYSLAPVSCPDIAAVPVKKILCDVFPGAAKEKAKLWGFEEYTTDYREIFDRDDIDIVDICTPAPSHADIAIDFIKAGKFVACEKPLVLTVQDGERLLEAVKEYHGRTADRAKRINNEESFALVLAQMKSGVTASRYQNFAYSGTGEDISFEVIGSKGSMRWSGANPSVFQLSIQEGDGRTNGFRNILMGPEHPYGPSVPGFGVGVADNMAFQAYEIVNAYCGDCAFSPSFEDAWEIIKVRDCIRESERTRQWVKC